jgi:hypothetical protein
MTVLEFVNIDKDLQTVQDISDVNIIILILQCIRLTTSCHIFVNQLMTDFNLQCSLVKPPPSVQSVVWR